MQAHKVNNGEVENMQIKLNAFETELITHNTHGTWHMTHSASMELSGCGVFAHQIVVLIYTVDP